MNKILFSFAVLSASSVFAESYFESKILSIVKEKNSNYESDRKKNFWRDVLASATVDTALQFIAPHYEKLGRPLSNNEKRQDALWGLRLFATPALQGLALAKSSDKFHAKAISALTSKDKCLIKKFAVLNGQQSRLDYYSKLCGLTFLLHNLFDFYIDQEQCAYFVAHKKSYWAIKIAMNLLNAYIMKKESMQQSLKATAYNLPVNIDLSNI